MSAFLQSGRFYHGETALFRVRFRPEADIANGHFPPVLASHRRWRDIQSKVTDDLSALTKYE
jgi:hypothetical protein